MKTDARQVLIETELMYIKGRQDSLLLNEDQLWKRTESGKRLGFVVCVNTLAAMYVTIITIQ